MAFPLSSEFQNRLRVRMYRRRWWLLRMVTRYLKNPRRDSLQYHYRALARNRETLQVIQVGANDGLVNDPLRDVFLLHEARAVLIEPHPWVFQHKLSRLYANRPGFQLLNRAIDAQPGEHTLYSLSFSLKRWATGLSSFDKSFLEAKIAEGYVEECARVYRETLPEQQSDWIREAKVPCMRFEEVLDSSGMQHVDILQIDAEGYDIVLLNAWPFERIKPLLIGVEIEHLNAAALEDLQRRMETRGYVCIPCGRDWLCKLKVEN